MAALMTAVAYLFGQAVNDIPADLFIPPDALRVVLESFEGPLDLLLYLIRKQNLDVLNIPMAAVTEQYLGYIACADAARLDLSAEYLLMAAVLVEIKSRLLLPVPVSEESEEETADPRAELVRRLLEYEQIKLAAAGLDALPRAGRDFAWAYLPVEMAVAAKLPEVGVADLSRAWLNMLARAQQRQSHQVESDSLSVRRHMSEILSRLRHSPERCLAFEQVFPEDCSIARLVVYFIALLELVKEGLVYLEQAEWLGRIDIYPADGFQAARC